MSFTIAVIGRPNVGKSTLFNKLVGRKFAIVDDVAGVTRDRREAFAELGNIKFKIVDTAGLEEDIDNEKLEKRMVDQTKIAVNDADLCLFVVDGRAGIVSDDIYFADWLRKSNKDAILLVNKCENNSGEIFDKEYYRLGLGQALAISAEHKEGFDLIYQKILPFFKKYQKQSKDNKLEQVPENIKDQKFFQIAVIGKPNAGKSTFLNKILGYERMVTGKEAGITRDAIATDFQFKDYKIRLIDTAGIRRKSNVIEKLEKMSLEDSFRSIRYAQVVVMIIDGASQLDHQELAIASMILKEGRGLVFAINKFDLIKDKKQVLKEFELELERSLTGVTKTPIIAISALKGLNVENVLETSVKVYQQWQSYITTSRLNEWLHMVYANHQPPMFKGKVVKLKYITQSKKRPPTFTLFTNYPQVIKGGYERYLINSLKEYFNLDLINIRILIRKSENPYKKIKYKKFSKKTKNS